MNTDLALWQRVLLGHACGDCFGAPFEFQENGPAMCTLSLQERRYLDPHKDVGNKRWRQPGLHTDDTQQALVALDLAKKGEDPGDFLTACREIAAKSGTGAHRGTGRNFRQALFTGKAVDTAGLGAAMRVGPAVAYLTETQDPEWILDWVRQLSLTTTSNPIGVAGAMFYAAALMDRALGTMLLDTPRGGTWELFLDGLDILQLDEDHFLPWAQSYSNRELKTPTDGFALTGVPWALCQVWESDVNETPGYEDSLRRALSVPGDSDTIGALVGGLAAVHHPVPDWMQEQLVAREHLFEWHAAHEWSWTVNEAAERAALEKT